MKLPFAFVEQYGVLLIEQSLSEGGSKWCLVHKETASLNALSEAIRVCPSYPEIEPLSDQDFEQQTILFYQQEGSHTLTQGIDDSIDLSEAADSLAQSEDLLANEDSAPVIRLVNAILSEAIKENASDVHIETFETSMRVRFRIDGVLKEIIKPTRALAPMLISRIKVMAKLDIAEKRLPQDGRLELRLSGQDIDVRVSTIPSTQGERVVLRLLRKEHNLLNLTSLGIPHNELSVIESLIRKPKGILLVTGPTGSGKTTSLYAVLNQLNNGLRNIMTIEDPVEYHIHGIGQTQVNTKAKVTFARGLRAILRQDPDVVMIGEIRDQETADIAIQSSLTGHLVLSTLHTNSAAGAITRLVDMGIEPFLLASSLEGVIAQRLVRKLCDHCKTPIQASDQIKRLMGVALDQAVTVYQANGCEKCFHQGYKGRFGVYEIIEMDSVLKRLIHQKASEMDIESHARTKHPSLLISGLQKASEGATSVEEVLRVAQNSQDEV
ncbi:type II secretion system ATPase GspE [Marinomonas sp. THO17]|uniref:type II secretion system ATPase GspE n=1 Tax=Marinomonas sp. THO17 TaxID=3149048 RepID=UPI00336BF6E4